MTVSFVLSSMPPPTKATAIYGPRIDELMIKIYADNMAEFSAMQASDIDLLDWPLPPMTIVSWEVPPYDTVITLDPFREIGMYQFDFNNNDTMPSYRNIKSPTSDPNFRHAIAHMVDKDYIIATYVGGYGAKLESPIMPWLRWYDPTITTHSYDPATACQILYDNGWREDVDPGSGVKVHFPATWPVVNGGPNVAGQNLEDVLVHGPPSGSSVGLIFYRRSDIQSLKNSGNLLINGDATHLGLRSIGIPVCDQSVPRSTTSPKVMYEKDFHIYTGNWILGRDPYYLYDLWHPGQYNPANTIFPRNYNNVNDPVWNTAVLNIKRAVDLEYAEAYSHQALQRFGEQVFFIPIWTNVGYMAHKTAWHALNVDSYGVRNWWNLYAIYNPSVGSTGGRLRWGFSSDVEMLNVFYSGWQWDWQILDEIYDTLIRFNPLNIAVDTPWMASNWTIGTWTNPNTGMTASKISFTLRTDLKWINPVSGTVYGTVTPADVVNSFQEVYDHSGWNFGSVADLFVNPDGSLKIEVSGNTITCYESIPSCWTFHWLGGLPITPKAVIEPLADLHGFVPGSSTFDINALVGSGAFYMSSYTPLVSCLLTANRQYFKTIVPNTDTNPTTIKLDWGIFKSNVKAGDWKVNVLDLIIVGIAVGWTGIPGEIPADINKDGKVNLLDLIIVATNMGATWN